MSKLILVVFAFLVLLATVFYLHGDHGDDSEEGGARCATGGFFLLVVLVAGTVIERLTTKKKCDRRGFDVVQKRGDGLDRCDTGTL